MRIFIVTPAPAGSTLGNRITARRWQAILRGLGHRVRTRIDWRGEACDLLIALHARKSARAVRAFRAAHPSASIVVALTGTDVYARRGLDAPARAALKCADRILVLQGEALRALAPSARRKARVILQSSARALGKPARRARWLTVVCVGHLRAVKDPLLAARAARALPPSSRVHIDHYGSSLDASLAAQARRENGRNARWRWRGERTHAEIVRLVRDAHLFVQTSHAEGGSAALSEAIVNRVPILSTRIAGSVGMLGAAHPGFFAPGDARKLTELLRRFEADARFRRALVRASARRAPLFRPGREGAAWRTLLGELGID